MIPVNFKVRPPFNFGCTATQTEGWNQLCL
jgi:hypothetical protein